MCAAAQGSSAARVSFYTMSENEKPDWLAELDEGGDAVRRQAEQLVQTTVELMQLAHLDWPKTGSRPALPISLRLAAAVLNSRPRELRLTPSPFPVWAPPPTTEISIAKPALIVGSGSVTLPRLRVSGQMTVQNPPTGHVERSVGQILAVVLVAIVASGLAGVQGPDRAAVDHYVTIISAALTIAVLIWSKQNKPK
jgi:hypothetical protein